MLILEDMARFSRLYFYSYSIDHDISLNGDTSYWSCQISLQPTIPGQMALLRKAFRGQDYIADDGKGELLVRFPVEIIGKYLRLDKLCVCLEPYYSGLAGATLQVQVLIAPNDYEYKAAFSRAQKWEWLLSSTNITELFMSGVITENGPEFGQIYHSCHQSDLNRNITGDIPHLVNQWDMAFHEIMNSSSSNMDVYDYMDIDIHSKGPAYLVNFNDITKIDSIIKLANSLELTDKYKFKAVRSSVESDINCVAMTDIVFAVTVSPNFNLFESDIHI